jgi:uncharacterized membrane protein YraQ (UPF0718 family)
LITLLFIIFNEHMETQNDNPNNFSEGGQITNNSMKAGILYVVGAVIIAVLIGTYFFLKSEPAPDSLLDLPTAPEPEESASLGEDVFEAAQEQATEELTENIPDANPLGDVEANPLQDYKNPFSN